MSEFVNYKITSEYKIARDAHDKLEKAAQNMGLSFEEFMAKLQFQFLRMGMTAAADKVGVDPDDLLEEIYRQTMQKPGALS